MQYQRRLTVGSGKNAAQGSESFIINQGRGSSVVEQPIRNRTDSTRTKGTYLLLTESIKWSITQIGPALLFLPLLGPDDGSSMKSTSGISNLDPFMDVTGQRSKKSMPVVGSRSRSAMSTTV
jgi:hypothetical protein